MRTTAGMLLIAQASSPWGAQHPFAIRLTYPKHISSRGAELQFIRHRQRLPASFAPSLSLSSKMLVITPSKVFSAILAVLAFADVSSAAIAARQSAPACAYGVCPPANDASGPFTGSSVIYDNSSHQYLVHCDYQNYQGFDDCQYACSSVSAVKGLQFE